MLRINVQKPGYNWILIKIHREIDLYTKAYMDIIMRNMSHPEEFVMTPEERLFSRCIDPEADGCPDSNSSSPSIKE